VKYLETKYTEYSLNSSQVVTGVTRADRNQFIKFVSLKSERESHNGSNITAFDR